MISKLLAATAAISLVATPAIAASGTASSLSLSHARASTPAGKSNRAGPETIGTILAIGVGVAAVVAGVVVTDDEDEPASP
ncbi:MAG: hypothetical protein CMN73_14505 [Sphingomonas sp.]|nr:hypothetical protein [Sphingomonas sp.]|tara:strand:- start:246 stop:488 length:243 start_codon:yes stop_codon:yes gene_type:complete